MSFFFQRQRIWLFILFAALFSAQSLYLVFNNSLTSDEPFETASGYFYWKKGDVITPRINPPVAAALQALPLFLLPVQTPHGYANGDERAYEFFFVDNLPFLGPMTVLPRLVNWLAGIALGWVLFSIARKESWIFLATVMGLWALNPTLIAHSSLAKSDLMVALFYLLSVLAYDRSLKNPGWKNAFIAGLLAGISVTTKVTALSLGGVFILLEIKWMITRKKGKGRPFRKMKEISERWAVTLLGLLGWIAFVYLPGTLLLRDHRFPLLYYFDRVLTGWHMPQKGWTYFIFMGQSSDQGNLLYLPLAFLLKTPVTLLALLAVGFILWAFKKIKLEPIEWITPLVVFLSVLPGSSIGVRLLLPAFPFFFLFAARAAEWVWNKSDRRFLQTGRWILTGLGLWLLMSLAFHFPNYLSYANESIDPDRKMYFFSNADLDWGQDHIRLCRLARERGWKGVKLAGFAGADPHFYGLDWEPWTQRDLQGPQPGRVYLISASFFQQAPVYKPEMKAIAQGWISEAKPTGKIGDCWWYYEIPGVTLEDDSPKVNSVPELRYYWKDSTKIPY